MLNEDARPQAGKLGIARAAYLSDPFSIEAAAHLRDGDFVVVDSYVPDGSFYLQMSLKAPVVAIDDLADRHVERYAALVLNYGVSAFSDMYEQGHAAFLLGPRYALLRADYWDAFPVTGDSILFVPGAADVLDTASQILGLWSADWPKIEIVLGALVPLVRRNAARDAVSLRENISLLVAPANFAQMMAGAAAVVCSASVTAYEALAMRKKLAVFAVAANQQGLGRILHDLGAAYDLGDWRDVTQQKLYDFFDYRQNRVVLETLVDPKGALRAAGEIVAFFTKQNGQ